MRLNVSIFDELYLRDEHPEKCKWIHLSRKFSIQIGIFFLMRVHLPKLKRKIILSLPPKAQELQIVERSGVIQFE